MVGLKETTVVYDQFCQEMRERTQEVHDESDRMINIKLAAVLTNTNLYAKAISEFYFIFKRIEETLVLLKDHPKMGILSFCSDTESRRTEMFEADLKFYLGEDWIKFCRPSPVVEKYLQRINECAEKEPHLIIAYVHSMYLALLAGGSILRRIIKKTLGLSGVQGLSLFEFNELTKTELRKRITQTINDMDLSREQKDGILLEKIRIFQMNNSIACNLPISWKNYKRIAGFLSLVAVAVAGVVGLVINVAY